MISVVGRSFGLPVQQACWVRLWPFTATASPAALALLREKVVDLSAELADLRPRYERELIWRKAGERHTPEQAPSPPIAEPPPAQAAAGRLAPTWRAGP